MFQPTNDQVEASDYVSRELLHGAKREVCLLGFAGTGKTWLAGQIIKNYLDGNRTRTAACTAPTNKAVHVLRRMSPVATNMQAWFGTLHAALGLKPRMNEETGEESFSPDPWKQPMRVDLLVVDEASMCGQSLHAYTQKQHICQARKILWLGDPAQLPPIGEELSLALKLEDRALLRQIVRHGGIIQEYVNTLRDKVENPNAPTYSGGSKSDESGEGVFICSREEFQANMLRDFTDERFKEDTNFVRAVSWTNRATLWGNNLVHRAIYGENADAFVVGQTLVAHSPVFNPLVEQMLLMATSDECKIQVASLGEGNEDSGGARFWTLQVELRDDSALSVEIWVIHPDDQHIFDAKLKQMQQDAKSAPAHERSNAWRAFYRAKELFAEMRPCYWGTCHKAQGSTYQRVYVAVPDINANRNTAERNRMMYTAGTRASKQLYLL